MNLGKIFAEGLCRRASSLRHSADALHIRIDHVPDRAFLTVPPLVTFDCISWLR